LIGGDIITEINGIPLTSKEKFFEIVQGLKLGATLHLTLFREGMVREIEYRLPERPILTSELPVGRASAPLQERRFSLRKRTHSSDFKQVAGIPSATCISFRVPLPPLFLVLT
jgi:hypothetical protein